MGHPARKLRRGSNQTRNTLRKRFRVNLTLLVHRREAHEALQFRRGGGGAQRFKHCGAASPAECYHLATAYEQHLARTYRLGNLAGAVEIRRASTRQLDFLLALANG
jgi:hypothetical protein